MTIPDFKKIGRLLKTLYAEIEKEAIDKGVDISSDEYESFLSVAQEKIRELVLAKYGFTLEEYRVAKEETLREQEIERRAPLEQAKQEIQDKIAQIKIPSTEDITRIAKEESSKIPPRVTHKTEIVKETTKEVIKELPTIVKETVIQKEEFDDSPLWAEVGFLNDRIDNLPKLDLDKFADGLRSEFSKHFEHNINTLGMPDFRKLAMGLREDIDELFAGVYGALHVHDSFAGAQSIAAGTTYTKLTCFTDVEQFRKTTLSVDLDQITIQVAGRYLVNCAIAAASGSNNVTFKYVVFKNGIEQNNVHTHRKYGSAGDFGASSMTGIIQVEKGDVLDVRARHDNLAAVDITITYANFNMVKIGA